MGLDCSHDAWHGAYSAFHTWRKKLAEVAGLPPLELMEGFYVPLKDPSCGVPTLYHGRGTFEPMFGAGTPHYFASLDDRLPISWDCLKPSPLHELFYHSDCDGEIAAENCAAIADELEKLIPLLPVEDAPGHIGNWKLKTQKFVDGLRAAAAAGESLVFA
jgi:hypothetical protein